MWEAAWGRTSQTPIARHRFWMTGTNWWRACFLVTARSHWQLRGSFVSPERVLFDYSAMAGVLKAKRETGIDAVVS